MKNGRPPGFTYTMSAEVKKRIAAEHAMSAGDRIARDVGLLRDIGPCKTWQYAERAGCSEQTGKNRLRRLFDIGLAGRRRERGEFALTYEAK